MASCRGPTVRVSRLPQSSSPSWLESGRSRTLSTWSRHSPVSIILLSWLIRGSFIHNNIVSKEGSIFLHTFNCSGHISRRDNNPELGRISLLFRNSSKGSFSCRSTIDSPTQCYILAKPLMRIQPRLKPVTSDLVTK